MSHNTPKRIETAEMSIVDKRLQKLLEEEGQRKKEQVDHPAHYNVGSIEVIDYIESLGMATVFCLANAIKYISRCQHKGKMIEDLKKARWYIDWVIERENKGNKDS